MSNNSNLNNAKKAKNDEWYTLFEDVKKELDNYKIYLEGKTILLPCDKKINNYNYENAFIKYFLETKDLKIKRLINVYFENGKNHIQVWENNKVVSNHNLYFI